MKLHLTLFLGKGNERIGLDSFNKIQVQRALNIVGFDIAAGGDAGDIFGIRGHKVGEYEVEYDSKENETTAGEII